MSYEAIAFDTLKFVQRLAQAVMFAEAQKVVLAEALDDQVATRADIHRLEHGRDKLRAELKTDIHDLRAEQRLMGWMLSVTPLLFFATPSMVAPIVLQRP